MPAGKRAKPDERVITRRMVLRRVRAVELPSGAEGDTLDELAKRVAKQLRDAEVMHAWVECGEFDGSKVGAIEQHAGKPGSPDAQVGDFKAIPARSWAGGVRHSQPPLPKVERELLP